MKKVSLLLTAVCSVILITSCCSNESKSCDDKNCAEKQCGEKKCDKQEVQTPDLKLFDVKGNVKSLTDEIGDTYNFTAEGKLDLPDDQIKRDAEGKIVSLTINELTQEIEWEEGNVAKITAPDHTTTFTYDDRGMVLTSYTEVDSWELSIYKYLKFDDKGNWIERERSWIGFSGGAGEDEDPIYRNKEVEKRTVVYF